MEWYTCWFKKPVPEIWCVGSNPTRRTKTCECGEMVDTPDLGSGALWFAGSSPAIRTKSLPEWWNW